jgi:hypothetical protein
VPARYAHLLAVRWLIGATFARHDVACYAVGVALAAAAEGALAFPARAGAVRMKRSLSATHTEVPE